MEREKIFLTIKVHPRARKRSVEEVKPGEYKVRVLSPPARGEANKEVIETLASHFDLPLSRIKIVRGMKSRHKLVEIEVDKKSTK
ncbi:MAG: DUF167 domain-containing protein [Candidatus Aminicenantes bacterium]|nr:MAG: DUF167 domain-containing protein [Candidatus Aminicenantes bacterium]